MAEQCSVLPCYQFDLAENKVLRKKRTGHKCLDKNLTHQKKKQFDLAGNIIKKNQTTNKQTKYRYIGHRTTKRLLIGQTLSPDQYDFRRHIWEITRQMTNKRLGTLMAAATFLIYYSTTRCYAVCLFVFCFYQCGNIVYCLVVAVLCCIGNKIGAFHYVQITS